MSRDGASTAAVERLTYAVEDGVAVITFDQPGSPVNTLSLDAGARLEELFERARADAGVQGVVLASAKKDNFLAGVDIEIFEQIRTAEEATRLSRQAQERFDRVDAFPKPVVAAIHGSCVGGGLELALACDLRLVSDHPKTSLALPEVQLGLLPGAGGTQRLPALIGAQAALELILTGRSVKAGKARRLGLVDEVVPAPILRAVALSRARELASGALKPPRPARRAAHHVRKRGLAQTLSGLARRELWTEWALEDNPLGRKLLFDQARKKLLRRTRGKYPGPEKALEAVRVGLESGREAGLAAEARLFGELCVTPVSRRLVEIFRATTALKKETGVSDPQVRAREVRKVGVVGGGLMGAGIAYVTAALQGVPARVKERDDSSAGRALRQVQALLEERVARRSLSRREAAATLALVTAGTDWSGFGRADLVIEAVPEELALKQAVLREVEEASGASCIFASNTSSLPITRIAEGARRPENVIGMHYFSPVHRMPLLEVITHPRTADWVTATCVEVGKEQGKTVIVVRDGVGFYTTRILAAYLSEAAHLVAEGAEIAELDGALVDFGFPTGPLALVDEIGIDVAAKVGTVMVEAFGSRMAAPPAFQKVAEDGRLGRKNGRGFYVYAGKKKEPDRALRDLLPREGARPAPHPAVMAERCVLRMVNEAVACLGEGILRSPRDGDIGAIFGLGFPAFLGGPFRHVDALGAEEVLTRLHSYRAKLGDRFTPAPELLARANGGRVFYPEDRA